MSGNHGRRRERKRTLANVKDLAGGRVGRVGRVGREAGTGDVSVEVECSVVLNRLRQRDRISLSTGKGGKEENGVKENAPRERPTLSPRPSPTPSYSIQYPPMSRRDRFRPPSRPRGGLPPLTASTKRQGASWAATPESEEGVAPSVRPVQRAVRAQRYREKRSRRRDRSERREGSGRGRSCP